GVRQHEEAHQPPPESEYISFAVIERHIFREVPAESNGPQWKTHAFTSHFIYLVSKTTILSVGRVSAVPVPIIEKSLYKRLKTDFHLMKVGFYQSFNSPMRRSSTTACERPLTPNFCIAFEIWLRTVFSDINKSWAISFVVLSCTKSSKTSCSRLVSNFFCLYSFLSFKC